MSRSGRGLLLVLVVCLAFAPGCSLLSFPIKLASTLFHTLFFWASAVPGTSPAPGTPLSAEDATRLTVRARPRGPVWIVPAGERLPEAARIPPSPGAVPVRIRVRGDSSPQVLARLLAARGIESR